MTTVLQSGGFDVVIYKNDHRPAHIHVIGGSGIVVINLNGRYEKPSVRENYGMKKGDLIKALQVTAEHKKMLAKEWKRMHPPVKAKKAR